MSRKEAILEAARKLFNETNTQSSTTNHIAKAMGISPGNLHYHYKNREEIIRLLYIKMKEESSLAIEALPKNFQELQEHEKVLLKVQWKYRFFFKELLVLFSRDKELESLYIQDNIAHRIRIRQVMQNLIDSGDLSFPDDDALEFLVDSILISWQFYNSFLHTLGKETDSSNRDNALAHTTAAIRPYLTDKHNAI